jgi:ribulose bisphosphate carboxylase small subunit
VSMYLTRHSLYVGAGLYLYVEQHSGHAGYGVGLEDPDSEELGTHSYTLLTLADLRRAADALAAVVARLEREEQQ